MEERGESDVLRRVSWLPKVLFFLSGAVLVFLTGFVVGSFEIFPFRYLDLGARSIVIVWKELPNLLGVRPFLLLEPARYEGTGVTRVAMERVMPGVTFLSGFFTDSNEMRLVAVDGTVIHRWPVRFSEIFKDPDHIRPVFLVPATDWNIDIHGALLLPDGSVVFNFEYGGLARIGKCGEVQWAVPRMTHHSVSLSPRGTLWVPGRKLVEGVSNHPPLQAPYFEDTILEISLNGEVLREISVIDLFFRNRLQSMLLADGAFDVYSVRGINREVVHLNDVEELGPDLAPSFPSFSPGDLLLSLRNFNLVLVVDPETEVVRWHQTGPWIRQHDPDFLASGTVSVFNNNTDGEDGEVFGGSNILELDPLSGEAVVRIGPVSGNPWYTEVRGKHQHLENGNVLITESMAGRVFEVTEQGDIVWEFINRYDEESVARVSDAIRYPEDYFTVDDWKCRN